MEINLSSIYAHIEPDGEAGGGLYAYLRQREGKRGTSPFHGAAARVKNPGRLDFSERSTGFAEKCLVGYFELETIIGPRHNSNLT